MDVSVPMNRLNSQVLEEMILKMWEEGLSASSINSYTRTLKVFFHKLLGRSYAHDRLVILLCKLERGCKGCEKKYEKNHVKHRDTSLLFCFLALFCKNASPIKRTLTERPRILTFLFTFNIPKVKMKTRNTVG